MNEKIKKALDNITYESGVICKNSLDAIEDYCNQAEENEKELAELREFARIMASRRLINPRLQDSSVMFYDVEKRHSEAEFDLVKKVVEKYGKN